MLFRLGYLVAILALNPQGLLSSDSTEFYLPLANNLLEYGTYSGSPEPPLWAEGYRLPGYPLFLALLIGLGFSYGGIAVVQILISIASCWLCYLLVRRLSNSHIASYLAAGSIAFDIPSIVLSTLLMSETIFTFSLLGSAYCFLRFIQHTDQSRQLFFSGLLLGLSILIRPIAILLPLALGLFLILIYRQQLTMGLRKVGIFLLAVGVFMAPWFVRNFVVFETIFFSGLGNVNLMYYHAAPVKAALEKIPLSKAQGLLYEEALNAYGDRPWEIVPFSRLEGKMARAYLFAHPWTYLKIRIVSIARLMGQPIRGQISKQLMLESSGLVLGLVLLQLLLLIILWLGAVFGLIYLYRGQSYLPLLFLIILLAYFGLMAGAEVGARFRVPMVPFLSVLAGIGWRKMSDVR